MIIIEPIDVTEANMTTDVPLSETEWTAGTTPEGEDRRIGKDLYRAVIETADDPVTGVNADPPTWIRIGVVNRFQMFDEFYHSQTVATERIEVTVQPSEVVNSVTLLNLDALEVRVQIEDGQGGTLYDETKSLLDNSQVVDYWEYFFSPILRRRDVTFIDLPAYSQPVRISVIGSTGGEVRIGGAFIGRQRIIGEAVYGTRRDLLNFSTKERDQFGRFQIVSRHKAKLVSYDVAVKTRNNDYVADFLEDVADVPCIYIGDPERGGTITYGYPRDFGFPYETPSISKLSLEVESVT
ncbi:hypothetical protein D1822_10845 [Phaeobacter inhibens]|uniref:hypothetical protein n=1 Tax=Phaeobacter inhibens TaxID=221822 RepID=UPI0001633051|nr:hypothetical protein [Phaeobacter inhibens]AFO91918.1 hypothetical protein PGA1_c22320 [Phaeobacter inhibens DSM 17395]AUQ46587.1 hypothetical protein PhaeoP10_02257 [Phaeobacter inhibens]AXT23279.1 hypothetical protein D1822_10845 [Phaeobacter inhibens]